ncbi:IS110 family transposase [Streptomyces sp. LBUM 1484]|nr:IS110 family transposase [Streptomyces sp. LBUM 1484]
MNAQITTLEDRITVLYEEADPGQVIASGPGFGVITAAGILGRLGDPNRFAGLAGIRAFTGLVSRVSQSGLTGQRAATRQGDPGLRETLFKAADITRHVDPTLAARYHNLVVGKGKHHNSASAHSPRSWSPAWPPAGATAPSTNSATRRTRDHRDRGPVNLHHPLPGRQDRRAKVHIRRRASS